MDQSQFSFRTSAGSSLLNVSVFTYLRLEIDPKCPSELCDLRSVIQQVSFQNGKQSVQEQPGLTCPGVWCLHQLD